MGRNRKGFNCRFCGCALKWDEKSKCAGCSTVAVKNTYRAIAAEKRENKEEVVVKESTEDDSVETGIIYSATIVSVK